MTRLPICSGEKAIRAFQRAGWTQDRQRGSHVTLTKSGIPVVFTVPLHAELGPGLLRSLIRKASLTPDQFRELLWPHRWERKAIRRRQLRDRPCSASAKSSFRLTTSAASADLTTP